jgi:hypothetical protein
MQPGIFYLRIMPGHAVHQKTGGDEFFKKLESVTVTVAVYSMHWGMQDAGIRKADEQS